MTATSMQGPPGGRVRHSWRCSRRSPLLDASRTLDDGTIISFRRCSSCGGSDVDSALLDRLIKPELQVGPE